MDDLTALYKAVVRTALYTAVVVMVVWLLWSDARMYANGFLLGMGVSLFNAYLLMIKIQRLSQQLVDQTTKKVNLGFIARISMALIVVMVAIKTPEIHLVSSIIGLFYVQTVTLFMGMLLAFKGNK